MAYAVVVGALVLTAVMVGFLLFAEEKAAKRKASREARRQALRETPPGRTTRN